MIKFVTLCIKYIVECFYQYDLSTFQILGQKSVKFFGGFVENLKFQKGHSDINWPLAETASLSEKDGKSYIRDHLTMT